jgi:hypothetical protein
MRVKSRLRPASHVRSAPPPSPRLVRPPRHPGLRPRPPQHCSDRRVRAPRHCHGPKPCVAAVRNTRRRRCSKPAPSPPGHASRPPVVTVFARELGRTALLRVGEAFAVSPSTALFGRATELPAQRRRRRVRSRRGRAHTLQLGRGGFGPLASDLLCYFLYIFKSMQIQKFVQD